MIPKHPDMAEKYQNRYRIESTRLTGWDYSNPGAYFITICIKDRKCILGNIVDNHVKLLKIGMLVDQRWKDIPNHFNYVSLGNHIVMPNHLHGVVFIRENPNICRDEALPRLYNNYQGKYSQMSRISPKPGSLSVIIGSYKSICTKQIRKKIDPGFAWQPRFYDHIIRDEKSSNRVQQYIIDNTIRWEQDRNNPNSVWM